MKIREASIRDIDSVVKLITAMLQDMASYGGHVLKEGVELSLQLRAHFTDVSRKENHIFLLAVQQGTKDGPIGVVEASLVNLDEVFQPKSVLHIHSMYVKPSYREEGIGRRLLEAALEWGKWKGCTEAELNVLARNPARKLYEEAGFMVFELEMRLEL
jgi:GNAT superfamily N-acetyltransferase